MGALLKKGWLKTPRRWRMILSLVFAEVLWAEKEKWYGPVNEWVEIAKKECGQTASKVINGTIRNIIRAIESGAIDVWGSLPLTLTKSYEKSGLGKEILIQFLKEGNYAFWYSFDQPKEMFENCHKLTVEGLQTYRLEQGIQLAEWIQDKKGFSQNPHAAQVSKYVAENCHEEGVLLDYCAAPGGKSLQVHSLNPNKHIDLYEMNEKRRKKLYDHSVFKEKKNLKILKSEEELKDEYEDILIDVPCGNSGVLNKSPEAIRHYWIPDDVFEEIQTEVLEKALNLLKKGGNLFYSTCSIENRENSARIKKFVQEFELQLINEHRYYPNIYGLHGSYLAQIKM